MQIFIIEFDFEYFLMMFADGKDADERLRILWKFKQSYKLSRKIVGEFIILSD